MLKTIVKNNSIEINRSDNIYIAVLFWKCAIIRYEHWTI